MVGTPITVSGNWLGELVSKSFSWVAVSWSPGLNPSSLTAIRAFPTWSAVSGVLIGAPFLTSWTVVPLCAPEMETTEESTETGPFTLGGKSIGIVRRAYPSRRLQSP